MAHERTEVDPEQVLRYWFGAPADAGVPRQVWFRAEPAFDAAIRERFGGAVQRAREGGFETWRDTPRSALALVLLLDQFTRNLHRGSALAFAGDARAQAVAQDAIDRGWDRQLAAVERWFLYLPLQHAESRSLQARSVSLFASLAAELGEQASEAQGIAGALDYAHRHAAIIERFGRFPHRNAVVGRESTADEQAFLAQPGSF